MPPLGERIQKVRFQVPYYLIVGERPVLATPTDDGGFDVVGYEWVSRGLIRDLHAWESLFDGGVDARRVDEATCRQQIESVKQQPAGLPDFQRQMAYKRLVNKVDDRDQQQMLVREAVLQKAAIEYNGDLKRVANIICDSIVFDSVTKLQDARRRLDEFWADQGSEVERVVDRFEEPLIDGWRDILVTIRRQNGTRAEMQMSLKAVVAARTEATALYKEQSKLNEHRVLDDRPLWP